MNRQIEPMPDPGSIDCSCPGCEQDAVWMATTRSDKRVDGRPVKYYYCDEHAKRWCSRNNVKLKPDTFPLPEYDFSNTPAGVS